MSRLNIPSDSITYIGQEIQHHLDFRIVQRGWDYYRQGAVIYLQFIDDARKIRAAVKGAELYNVNLDLDFFSVSHCTCPYEGYCKHMAAVFFLMCSETGLNPAVIYGQWNELHNSPQWNAPAFAKPAKAHTKARLQTSSAPALLETSTFAQWREWFDGKLKHRRIQHAFDLESILSSVRKEAEQLTSDWRPVFQRYFTLCMNLYMMRVTQLVYDKVNSSSYNYYLHTYRNIAKDCMDWCYEVLDRIEPEEIQQHHPALLQDLALYMRENIVPMSQPLVDGFHVYRALWWDLLSQPERTAREIEWLQERLGHKPQLPAMEKDFVLGALAMFDIFAENDDQAWEKFAQQTHYKAPSYLFSYLHYFMQMKQWERLASWLRRMLPMIKNTRSDIISTYSGYWSELDKHVPCGEEWTEMLASMLPGSYHEYAFHLLQTERYREWVDLQLFMCFSPMELDKDDLKTVGKADPQLLLPLYHQFVERCIALKNRGEYKAAVRLLKKLRQFYKRLKREQQWESFIVYLSRKYSRYRAFQEELRKGKLVS
jgi:hypothetical protein